MPGEAYGPIQVPPEGLLGYLNLKNSGVNPPYLSDTVVPTVEMWRQYLLANQEALITSNIAVNAVGGFGSLVNAAPSPLTGAVALEGMVPPGEVWAVHSFSGSMNGVLAATQELAFMAMIEYGLGSGGGGIGVATGQVTRIFTQNDGPHFVSDIPGGFMLLPPTAQLYVWCSRVVNGPFNVNLRARITRLRR